MKHAWAVVGESNGGPDKDGNDCRMIEWICYRCNSTAFTAASYEAAEMFPTLPPPRKDALHLNGVSEDCDFQLVTNIMEC